MAAAVLALAINASIAWQLPALLVPPRRGADAAATPLQVVWIAAQPRLAAAAIAPVRKPRAPVHVAPTAGPVHEEPASPGPALDDAAPPLLPARPMVAVYLQQARRWAQDHPVSTAPTDPFARRPVALADQPASRFRLKRPVSVADAVAMVGVVFGNGPHPCERNPDDVAAYATGGDALALQMALDVERHCRP